jgi:hypothetical protein
MSALIQNTMAATVNVTTFLGRLSADAAEDFKATLPWYTVV